MACVGVGGDKRRHFVGSAGHDVEGVGGEQMFVGSARQDVAGLGGEAYNRLLFCRIRSERKLRQFKRQP